MSDVMKHSGTRNYSSYLIDLPTYVVFHLPAFQNMYRKFTLERDLCLVRGSGHIASSPSPVDVNVLPLWILLVGVLRLDAEGMSTEVVPLCLK